MTVQPGSAGEASGERGASYGASLAEPFDLAAFGLGEMLRCGLALRAAARGAPTMERAAQRIVAYLYDAARDARTGERCCALVRCFVTLPFRALDAALQDHARALLDDVAPPADARCLTLLATIGDESTWRSRHLAAADRLAPLAGAAVAPYGTSLLPLVQGLALAAGKSYSIFHVAAPIDAGLLPTRDDGTRAEEIRSVVGFGGTLASGDVVAAVLYARTSIPAVGAARFRNTALDLKASLHAYPLTRVFDALAS